LKSTRDILKDTKGDKEPTNYGCYNHGDNEMKSIPMIMLLTLIFTGVALADQEIKYNTGKDMCLLDIKNCTGQSYYDIVDKIARLKAAIEIGLELYSPEECNHLNYLLEEAFYTAERIGADPSQVPEMRDK
jgi:hypothetical protein